MVFEYNDKTFVPLMNFFKNKRNWHRIFERAAESVAPEVRDDAEKILYTHFKKRKGKLGDSIEVEVEAMDDSVVYEVGSAHPAAGIIEYGGYSEFPPWGPGSNIWEYAEAGDKTVTPDTFAIAWGIFMNQPFKEPHPFLKPAADKGVKRLNKVVYEEFNRVKP